MPQLITTLGPCSADGLGVILPHETPLWTCARASPPALPKPSARMSSA